MKIISSLTFTLFLSVNCIAQNIVTDSTATVLGYWKKGDHARYSLQLTKEKYDKGKKISGGGSVSDIDITVAEANDSGYTIHWKYSKITVQSAGAANNPLVDKFSRLVEGVTFKYTTEASGEFKELINWSKVNTMVNKTLDELVKLYPANEMKNVLEQTRSVFSSKEGMEQLLMKDMQLLHSIYGGEYTLHDKITAATQLPNFLGGNPFPAVLTIEMKKLDKINKTCHIIVEQVVDAEKAAKEIGAFLEKSGKPDNEKLPAQLDISDKNSFDVDLTTGWMKKVVFTRTAGAEGRRSVETHTITKL